MATAFKAAGGIVLGAGLAGAGALKMFVDAAADHQVAMASVDATLKNVSSSMGTYTTVVGGSATSTKDSKKAIQEQIQALEDQKAQLTINNAEETKSVTVTTGHGKTLKEHTKIVHDNATSISAQKLAIDQQILSLKESEQGVAKSGSTTGSVTKIIDNASMSYANLKKTADNLSDSYLRLGFQDQDTQLAFAQDVRITGNVADAKKMLSAAADYARLKNEDLGTATQQLSLAYAGNEKALKSLGIELPKGTKGMDAISAVSKTASGQADAFSKTWDGAMQVLSATFDKFKSSMGDRLLPTLTNFINSIIGVIQWLNKLSPQAYDTITKVLLFGTAFALIAGPLLLIIGFLPALQAGFVVMSGAILPVIGILAAVALAGYLIYTHWNQITDAFNKYKPVLEEITKELTKLGSDVLKKLQEAFDATTKFVEKHKTIVEVLLGFLGTFLVVYAAINTVLGIGAVVMGIMTAATTAFGIVMAFITSPITLVALAITALIVIGYLLITHWNQVSKVASSVWNGITSAIKGAVSSAGKWIADFINGVINGIDTLIKGVNSVAGKIPGIGKNLQLPQIPNITMAFENGGYVPNTGLALVHAGEFVLSKNMLQGKQSVPSNISSTTNNTPVNINIDHISSDMDMNLLGHRVAFAMRNAR